MKEETQKTQSTEIVKSKPLFKSKTAIAGLLVTLAGALGFTSSNFHQFLASNAESILLVLGLLNILLRYITKGRVVLFSEPS